MANRRATFADVAAVLGIGILCLPILQFLPTFEESRTEARIAKAYIDVRRLRDSSTAPAANAALAEQDPWGKPYRMVLLPNGGIRVLSYGPNQSSPTGETDGDDIYSDMPTNPAKDNIRRKRLQILVVFGITAAAWFLLTVLYLRSR